MAGENCIMGASNFDYRLFRVESFDIGIEMIADAAQSRFGQTLYFHRVVDDGLAVVFLFSSYEEYRDFAKWLIYYGVAASNPDGAIGPMRVVIPSQNFDKYGIPTTGISLGDDVRNTVFRMNVNFQGAKDPLGYTSQELSQFVLPKNDITDAPYFYPGGKQLAGQDSAPDFVDSLYNVKPSVPPILSNPTAPGGPKGLPLTGGGH